MSHIDTSPAALRAVAEQYAKTSTVPANFSAVLRAIAAEKEAQANQECAIRNLLTTVGGLLSPLVENGKPISIGEARDVLKQVRVTRDHLALQHHPEQPLEMVAPSDVPLPEPYDHIHEWDTPQYVERDLDSAPKNGRPPNRSIPVFTTKQFVLGRSAYAEAYTKAKVAAEREWWLAVVKPVIDAHDSEVMVEVYTLKSFVKTMKKGTI